MLSISTRTTSKTINKIRYKLYVSILLALTFTGCPGGQCSRYQFLTNGTSRALLDRPDLKLKGLGAHNRAIPFAVLSVYKGQSCKNGWQLSPINYKKKKH